MANNKNLIELDSISVDGSKTRAYANKYNNLTNEDVQKLLYRNKQVNKKIVYDETVKENKTITKKMTGKVITDYTSDAKELLAHKFETPE